MSRTSFDVTELTRAASTLRRLATETKASGVATGAALALNKSWGSDAIGTAFAGVYQPAAEEAMRAVLDAAPHLGDIADKLDASAERYAHTEQANTQQANTQQARAVDPSGADA